MANIGIGNVETYVRELLAEYFGSEAEGDRYANKGNRIADDINDRPVLNQGRLVKKIGQSVETNK